MRLDFDVPGIPIESKNVEIIEKPTDFYQVLITQINKANRRITLSSLYLGEGDEEENLVEVINKRLEETNIELTILLDFLRGSRISKDGKSSRTMLKSIADKGNIFLYHTPELSGFLKRALPARADEIVGLQHMKLYIFDDNVLISGANLSSSYFLDRQDRYYLFKNCKPLADFFDKIVKAVGETSFVLQNEKTILSSKCDFHPFQGNSEAFRKLLKSRVEAVIDEFKISQSENSATDSKTMIYPILQMGLLGINQELEFLRKVFSSGNREMHLTLASGYFNLTRDYEDLISNDGRYEMDILTASPFANGFFGSRGFSNYIPALYSHISRQFLENNKEKGRFTVRMHEYFRKGWTFHAKGLWIEEKDRMMTVIGSSNYGYRSAHRDLEAQVVVVTSEQELMDRISNEKRMLFEYSSLLDNAVFQKPEHHVPIVVRLISRFVRSFL